MHDFESKTVALFCVGVTGGINRRANAPWSSELESTLSELTSDAESVLKRSREFQILAKDSRYLNRDDGK